jgi:hypothetical protein
MQKQIRATHSIDVISSDNVLETDNDARSGRDERTAMSESLNGSEGQDNQDEGRARHRKRAIKLAVASVAIEVAVLWRRGYRLGGNVIVRCRAGHEFTTIWVPAASVKSLRLGPWRFQYCPVGKHWSVVTPVNRADLSAEQLQLASEHKDIRIP